VPPSPPAGDAAFLRRVTLDLTGRQPRPDEIREFLKEDDPEKRAKLVDSLLASPDFVRFWRIKLGDLLQITSARFPGGSGYYFIWLDEQLAKNAPWDRMVRELLTTVGDPMSMEVGPPITRSMVRTPGRRPS